MRLHLGCNDDLKLGWTNVDQIPQQVFAWKVGADYVQADLSERWPFDDSSADYILANDVFEHLLSPDAGIPPKVWCLNESWRVLRPGGILEFTVPCIHLEDRNRINSAAWSDPSHVSKWTYEDVFYYAEQFNTPTYERGRLGPGMGIEARFRFPEQEEDSDGFWHQKEGQYCLGLLRLEWRVEDYGPKRSRRSKIHARLEAVK